MKTKGLYNFYEINSFCKSEGMDTDFFISEFKKNKINEKRSIKKVIMALHSMVSKVKMKATIMLEESI